MSSWEIQMKPVPGGQVPPAGGYSLPQHVTRTLRLAIPAMLARAGMVILWPRRDANRAP